jgi:hypothetical protein
MVPLNFGAPVGRRYIKRLSSCIFDYRHWKPVVSIRGSVADPRRLSRISDLGSRIPDPKTATNERGEKNMLSYRTIFCSHKQMLKKIIWANFQRIVKKLSKIWVSDPGSEIRDSEKTYSGSRIQESKRHRIPDPDPQHVIFC